MKIYNRHLILIASLSIFMFLFQGCFFNNKERKSPEKLDKTSSVICVRHKFKIPLRWNFNILYYDNDYLFGSRDYGRSEHPWGKTEPGFFVHSKKFDAWLRVDKISTKKGVFGLGLMDLSEEDKVKMAIYPVDMGQKGLEKYNYCSLPLRTSGSIAFPEEIKFLDKQNEYILAFFKSPNVEAVKTTLKFYKSDLDLEFENIFNN